MMTSTLSVNELCEELWKIEENLDLLNKTINGIYFWEVIRFPVFGELSKELVGYGQAHTMKNGLKDKLTNIISITWNSIVRNPLRGKYFTDFIIYDHPRKVNLNGNNIDIYTEDFIQTIQEKNFNIIEYPHHWKHSTSVINKNRKYADHEILLNYIKKKRKKIKLGELDKQIIKTIENELKNRFGNINIDIYSLTENLLQSFILKFEYHKALFLKRKPQEVYVVVSYSNIPIIAAAKSIGIEVIEFQHGVITDFHFAYNFSDNIKELKYFPDKLYTFGEYWWKTKRFPKQTKLEVYGFPYLNKQLETYKDNSKVKNQILFLSQGTIGRELSKRAKALAQTMPSYQFIYKLHPGEFDRWKTEYPELVEASQLKNFEVIDNNKNNLYLYFAESEYQIGVYSTAIFEGLTLKCKTILFDLPGIEYMTDLINKDIVKVVRNTTEAIQYIEDFSANDFPKGYFFKG